MGFFAVCVSIYYPAFTREKVWDDIYLLGLNPFIKTPVVLGEIFRHGLWGSVAPYYRPVQNVSYLLEYLVTKDFTLLAHWTNVFLHSLSATLLVVLLLRLEPLWGKQNRLDERQRFGCALFVGLVWLVHPIHNAAVAYNSGRADSLVAVFAIGAWLLYEKARSATVRRFTIGWALASMISLLVALCSKELALTWIAFFLLFGLLSGQLRGRGLVWTLSGIFIVLGAYAWLHSLPAAEAVVSARVPWKPFWFRSLLALAAAGDYCRLLFWPGHLTMERSVTALVPGDGLSAWVSRTDGVLPAIGLVFLSGLAAGCFWPGRGALLRRLGAGWFAIGFLPISNLISLMAQVAEHWIYHASIGILLFLVGCVIDLPARRSRLLFVLLIPAVLALGVRTWIRAQDWAGHDIFVQRTLAGGARSSKMLGFQALRLGKAGKVAEEEALLREILARDPGAPSARVSLANCLRKQGRSEEADAIFRELERELGAETAGASSDWYWPLRVAIWMEENGRNPEALSLLGRISIHFPNTWEIANAYSRMLVRAGRPNEALSILQRFVEANWWHFEARVRVGEQLLAEGNLDEAARAFAFASRLDVHDGTAFAWLARIDLARHNAPAAIAHLRDSLERDPESIPAREIMVQLLRDRGDLERAKEVEQEIRAIRSGQKPGIGAV